MSDFQKQYQVLHAYAKNLLLKEKDGVDLQADDLINHAFIENHNNTFDIDSYKKSMLGLLKDERRRTYNYKDTRVVEHFRQCIRCREDLPISAFRVSSGKYSEQTRTTCKSCENIDKREREWRQGKRSPKKTVDTPVDGLTKGERYRRNNREKLREKGRQYVKKNPDRIAENMRKYYYRNREKILQKRKEKRKCILLAA